MVDKLYPDRRGQSEPERWFGPRVNTKPCPACGFYVYTWEIQNGDEHAKHSTTFNHITDAEPFCKGLKR